MTAGELEILKKMRRDAEAHDRDEIDGIRMLRSWFRALHIKLVIGWDVAQDMSQGKIVRALGEYPEGHDRQFNVRTD